MRAPARALSGHARAAQAAPLSRTCSGRMKPVSSVLIAPASHSASMAEAATSPSRPPPKAAMQSPHSFAPCSCTAASCASRPSPSGCCASSSSWRSSSCAARPGGPTKPRRMRELTEGRPEAVNALGSIGWGEMPCRVMALCLRGAGPTRPPASHATHSGLGTLNSRVAGTCTLPARSPANSSCRIWRKGGGGVSWLAAQGRAPPPPPPPRSHAPARRCPRSSSAHPRSARRPRP